MTQKYLNSSTGRFKNVPGAPANGLLINSSDQMATPTPLNVSEG